MIKDQILEAQRKFTAETGELPSVVVMTYDNFSELELECKASDLAPAFVEHPFVQRYYRGMRVDLNKGFYADIHCSQ